jgi:PAS domain S-box-containing protein
MWSYLMGSEPTLAEKWDALIQGFDGVGFVLTRDGTHEEVISNRKTESLLADDLAVVEGSTVHDLFAEETADRLLDTIQQTLVAGETTSVEYSTAVEHGRRWFDATVTPLPPDAEDPERVLWLAEDVTERKRYEEELQRYEIIVEASGDLIYTADEDGNFTYVNDAFGRVTGYDRMELIGAHASLLMDEEDLQKGRDLIESLLSSETDTGTFEMDLVTASGARIRCENNVVLLPFDDQYRGSAGVIRDITNRQERERQLAVLDRILRHNLRNDMNVILGHASRVIADGEGSVVTAGEKISDVGEGLLGLIEKERELADLLEESPPVRPVELTECVDPSVEYLRSQFPAADISVSMPDSVPVAGVPELRRAVYELCENAIRHADSDAPAVEIRVTVGDDAVDLVVADTGPPIPKKEREVLAGDAEIGPLSHGTGLGLRLVEWIVSHCRGSVTVESNDPTGNVVRVRLSKPEESGVDSGSQRSERRISR